MKVSSDNPFVVSVPQWSRRRVRREETSWRAADRAWLEPRLNELCVTPPSQTMPTEST